MQYATTSYNTVSLYQHTLSTHSFEEHILLTHRLTHWHSATSPVLVIPLLTPRAESSQIYDQVTYEENEDEGRDENDTTPTGGIKSEHENNCY